VAFYYFFDLNKKKLIRVYDDFVWDFYYRAREVRSLYHRFFNATYYHIKLGFNPKDVWSLDHSIALYILPRLKHLKKVVHGHPDGLTFRQWKRELDKMIAAFSIITDETKYYHIGSRRHHPHQKTIDAGLDAFRKHYHHLWD
jgi:hypothetical protein